MMNILLVCAFFLKHYILVGAVYIYDLVDTAWTQTGKLFSPNPKYRDYFGTSVKLYQNFMAIGADGVDSSHGSEVGN